MTKLTFSSMRSLREKTMRKLVVIVTAAIALLLAGGLASNAQTSRGAANIHAQAQNY